MNKHTDTFHMYSAYKLAIKDKMVLKSHLKNIKPHVELILLDAQNISRTEKLVSFGKDKYSLLINYTFDVSNPFSKKQEKELEQNNVITNVSDDVISIDFTALLEYISGFTVYIKDSVDNDIANHTENIESFVQCRKKRSQGKECLNLQVQLPDGTVLPDGFVPMCFYEAN